MRLRVALIFAAALVAGCSSQRAEDQVTIRLRGERPRDIVAVIEERLLRHDFAYAGISHPNAPGSPLEARFYKGRRNANATVYVNSDQCVGFVTYVDLDETDTSQVKAAFADVRAGLKQRERLEFTIGDCSNPAEPF
ncbi:hypothetical protein SAMN04487939_104302 [Lysobacter sp. yr284]|uniref:hypothetical protein n=1 Tax=Lysobacter sp. yr284 TaxID=1761791 RepID=UPI0008948E93|nr:hypothetical protein [Lysobacter sp. yr284]SDY65999.1 hypothetical protein SAMN04487939_104302 [Lysobacter sp. yr284]